MVVMRQLVIVLWFPVWFTPSSETQGQLVAIFKTRNGESGNGNGNGNGNGEQGTGNGQRGKGNV